MCSKGGPDLGWCHKAQEEKSKETFDKNTSVDVLSEMRTEQGSLTPKFWGKSKKCGQTKEPGGWRKPETV